jgi:hypothetical protein
MVVMIFAKTIRNVIPGENNAKSFALFFTQCASQIPIVVLPLHAWNLCFGFILQFYSNKKAPDCPEALLLLLQTLNVAFVYKCI